MNDRRQIARRLHFRAGPVTASASLSADLDPASERISAHLHFAQRSARRRSARAGSSAERRRCSGQLQPRRVDPGDCDRAGLARICRDCAGAGSSSGAARCDPRVRQHVGHQKPIQKEKSGQADGQRCDQGRSAVQPQQRATSQGAWQKRLDARGSCRRSIA